MRIEINRDECPVKPASVSDCKKCVVRFLTTPQITEQHCFTVVDGNQASQVTVEIRGTDSAPVVVGNQEIWSLVSAYKD